MVSISTCAGWNNVSVANITIVNDCQVFLQPIKMMSQTSYFRGYVKPRKGLVKFAVRLRGKNVEVRITTSLKNVNAGTEAADGMKDIN